MVSVGTDASYASKSRDSIPQAVYVHDDVIKLNIFRVTGPLVGEFNGHMLIPITKASDAEFWCFLWFAPESTVE